MKKSGEGVVAGPAPAAWPRRAVLALWVLVFALAGVSLAARWDSLVSRLARPPAGAAAVPAAQR